MARDCYFSYQFKFDDEEYGTGGGYLATLRYDNGEWVDDDMIEYQAESQKRWFIQDLKRIRDKEMELDRKAAEPFWKGWLG